MIWALPGFFGLPSDWDGLRQALGRTVEIHPVDLWAESHRDLADWARHFNAQVARCDSNPTLLGYSLGGRLALQALLRQGAPFKRALLISTHFGLSHADERAARIANDERWAERLLSEEWAQLQTDWNNQAVFKTGTPIKDGSSMPGLRCEADFDRVALSNGMRNWSLGRQDFLLPRLHEISIPVTLMVGSQDERFVAQAEAAAGQFPHGELVIVPGAGHRVSWERSDILPAYAKKLLGQLA